MTDETANLILERLREIRADLAAVKADVAGLRAELHSKVGELKQAVSGLAYILAHAMGEIQDGKARLDRLEARP